MGTDAKDIGTLIWKIIRITTSNVYTCVRKYPIVSAVSAATFLLYTFLPRLFYFILCSSPFIACSAFYLRNHLRSKPSKTQSINTANALPPFSPEGSERGGTRRAADLKHQRSVRRNARRKVEEVGKDWDSSQASEDERDQVILTTLYGEFPNLQDFKKDRAFLASQEYSFEPNLDGEKKDRAFLASQEYSFEPNLDGEKKDRAFLASQEYSSEPNLDEETRFTTGKFSGLHPYERLTSGGGETEVECSSSSSSEGEEEEEEETSREDKKIIAWTDDDQKNLMDLGNSEMERNKRLEHLITRRRTRRQVLLAAERSLMDMEVPPVCVGRNYFGLDHESYMIDGLQMPESAPSVLLLPTKNPFDLPYDPQEEKPDLSGDSFHQEFSAANPNPSESSFCHHESFCRRILPSEIQVDSRLEQWKKSTDGLLRPQGICLDLLCYCSICYKVMPRIVQLKLCVYLVHVGSDDDGLVGKKPLLTEGNNLTLAETKDTETEHMTETVVSDSNSLLVPKERVDSNVSDQADSSGTFVKPNGDHHRGGKAVMGLIPRKTVSRSTSLAPERQTYMEHFGYSSTGKGHKVTKSGESDLQVEFSEVGSPPTTVDWNHSSDDEKSPFVNESDTVKKTGFSGEENEGKEKSILDRAAESQMLPAEKLDQDFNMSSQESDAAKQFEGLSDGIDVNGRSEEEATVPHTNEVILEEPPEHVQHLVDEMKMSYDVNEPGPSEVRTNQDTEGHFGRNHGGLIAQEMQEILEPEAQMLPVEKLDQDFNMSSQESDAAKQFEDLSDGTDVNGRSEEEATVPHTNEVILEEPPEHLQHLVDDMKISYDSDEPGSSEVKTNQDTEEHLGRNHGVLIAQEVQEIVEPEALVVNHVTSDESDTSPTSVLPDMSLPLGQTLTLTSESVELAPASQQAAVIPDPEPSQSQLGGDRNSIETEAA
ncbi:hypothetical protein Bca4012_053525 [Brassica carinata]